MTDQITTINPANGQELRSYPAMNAEMIERYLDEAVMSQTRWRSVPIDKRVDVLRRVAEALRTRSAELAAIATEEMGKPTVEAVAEVEKCAWVCDYYADTSPHMLADEETTTNGRRSWIAYEPLGVVLAIMPWNFPFWQVFRFAAPALAAGNAVLLKHSPNVTGCALAVEDIWRAAGLPNGVLTTLVVAERNVPTTADQLISDPRIAAVTLTGSNRAGQAVAAAAGQAVKKSVLELGGSDPFVVLADAVLDDVVPKAVAARFLNAGQSCLCAKRFIVHESIVEEFGHRFAEAAAQLPVGDPSEPGTRIGPLARADLADNLEHQVHESVAAGARLLLGGDRLDDRGPAWFAPTVLVDVTSDMPVMREETFGPVAAITSFVDDAEAVRIANCTRYGLGASVWSANEHRATAVGSQISSGALFVNAVVASDPRLPFGGIKESGYGRELGKPGAREFINIRTVQVG